MRASHCICLRPSRCPCRSHSDEACSRALLVGVYLVAEAVEQYAVMIAAHDVAQGWLVLGALGTVVFLVIQFRLARLASDAARLAQCRALAIGVLAGAVVPCSDERRGR